MSNRPEALFPLFASLDTLPGVGPKTAENFAGLHVTKPKDLLFTLPKSVIDRRPVDTVIGIAAQDIVTVNVDVVQHHKPSNRNRPYRVTVSDAQTSFDLVFFHARGDYLSRILPEGSRQLVSGRIEHFDHKAQMAHPDYIVPLAKMGDIPTFEAVYNLTAGVTTKTMQKAVAATLEMTPDLEEWIDPELLKREGWPNFADALISAHNPQSVGDAMPQTPARRRLAYDELLAHQLTLAIARKGMRIKKGRVTRGDGAQRRKTIDLLPYHPTNAQIRSIQDIVTDMGNPIRMNRLLQGDVGAGKTLVAFMALLVAVEAGGQGVLMAPTEILARQHFEGLHELAKRAGVTLDILTGRDKGPGRQAKVDRLLNGEIQILVGTHAVFQDDVVLKDLRLAVIDEQHRFGVAQRMALGSKGNMVDVLVMTATPIPRSLALAQYGDMDVSILDEKPPGRKPITTAVVPLSRLDSVIEKMRVAISEGKQAYWVCPLVEESEVSDLTAAEERFKVLRAALGDNVVGLVHGQMQPSDKDQAMKDFQTNKTKVLVATTVIEVGVDVPNASIMVIERAEHFGLSQLHQLRGRVGRGDQASTCLLLYQAPLSQGGDRRLKTMRDTEDGFKIAEEDLAMRGAGDVIGTAQSGLPRFRVADLESQAGLLAMAQKDARNLLEHDPDLTSQRGTAARHLLWLMEQEKSIRLISVG